MMSDTRRGNRCLWAVLVFLVACLGLAGGGCSTTPALSVEEQMALWEEEGAVFRTGIMGSGGAFNVGDISYAVSPEGTRILFTTDSVNIWLLELKSGHVSRVPVEAGRLWAPLMWSPDGKQVAAVSFVQENDGWKRELILLNDEDWSDRKLTIPLVDFSGPSFSADGKFIFFVRGLKTSASRVLPGGPYDLYAYDLASGQEKRLTYGDAYQMARGYDDGKEIFFSAEWLRWPPSMKPDSDFSDKKLKQGGIYALNKKSLSLRLLEVDQRDGFFDLLLGGKDQAGNIYFTASLNRKGRDGGYTCTVYRCDTNGQHCVRLSREMYFNGNVKIASQTGDVFVDDRLGHEIVFRRLSQSFKEE